MNEYEWSKCEWNDNAIKGNRDRRTDRMYLLFIFIFWCQGLEDALQDPFRAACYDSIQNAIQSSHGQFELHVGDCHSLYGLTDKQDIDFDIIRQLQSRYTKSLAAGEEYPARNLAVISDIWRLAVVYKHGGIYLDFSTFIIDATYLTHLWNVALSNHQYYGFKDWWDAQVKWEYAIWQFAAPKHSYFIGMWLNLALGKLTQGRDIATNGYVGIETQKDKWDRFSPLLSEDYVSLSHHSANALAQVIEPYKGFRENVLFEHVRCGWDIADTSQTVPSFMHIINPRDIHVQLVQHTKLEFCSKIATKPSFYKFFGSGKVFQDKWIKFIKEAKCNDKSKEEDDVLACFVMNVLKPHLSQSYIAQIG